ncbi:MAG: hypothetical protein GX606_04795 [Elusimicrobia bacterium]|nr:hypothetical protein [Elusimicrobiota bacterium]
MKKVFFLALVLFCAGRGFAADLGSLLEQAAQSQAAGQSLETVRSLREAVLSVWEEIPFTAFNTRLVSGDKDFSPRSNNSYGPGETIHIVTELAGHTILLQEKGYAIDVATDLYIMDTEGNVLSGKENFGAFHFVTPMPNTEFFLELHYTLTGAPEGAYDLKTVVRDLNSDKRTDLVTRVRIRG